MNPRRLSIVMALCASCAGPSRLQPGEGAPAGHEASAARPAATPAAPPRSAPAAVAPVASPAPVPVLPFDEAVAAAADMLFSTARLSAGAPPFTLVIDPLIDGVTGEQSHATRSMGDRIASIVRSKYSSFEIEPFNRQTVARSPIVLIGTFTPVGRGGKTEGPREAYRICLALIDLRSGRVVGRGWARARMTGVDATPGAFFRDSPTWAEDASVDGYVRTCQSSQIGGPIDPVYLDRILLSALVNEALDAYDAGHYAEALETYREAQHMAGGADEARVLNGLYMAHYKLGHMEAASEDFSRIVDHGLARKQLAVKFLFAPGSTGFWRDPAVSGPYPVWLQRIAQRSAAANSCLEISGHTSPTGPEPLNKRLSQRRAEVIRERLAAMAPLLNEHTVAFGMGSSENLVGTGRDDASDALDRRVAFKVVDCRTGQAKATRYRPP